MSRSVEQAKKEERERIIALIEDFADYDERGNRQLVSCIIAEIDRDGPATASSILRDLIRDSMGGGK